MIPNFYPKIVFYGTPDFAVASLKALIDHSYNVVAVVTAPDKPAGRGQKIHYSAVKEYALSQNLPILQPEKLKNAEFIEHLKSLEADLQVVVAFRMLPEVVWNMPPLGTINVHASLLPQYRGAAPINWAIINGEKITGVTTFKLQHEIDTGPLLLQKEIQILEEDNVGTVYEKLMHEGAQLLLETVEGLQKGNLKARQQVLETALQHAPKIFKEDCQINWNQKANQIHNLVRGLSPYPGAFTTLKEKQLKIFQTSVEPEGHHQLPGSWDTDSKTYLKFAAQDGWVSVLDLQYEGKKRMSVADFLRGFRL